jgi:hypothetical protein
MTIKCANNDSTTFTGYYRLYLQQKPDIIKLFEVLCVNLKATATNIQKEEGLTKLTVNMPWGQKTWTPQKQGTGRSSAHLTRFVKQLHHTCRDQVQATEQYTACILLLKMITVTVPDKRIFQVVITWEPGMLHKEHTIVYFVLVSRLEQKQSAKY